MESDHLYDDFLNVFIGNVKFFPSKLFASNPQKFRAYMLDLRDKHENKSGVPDFTVCDLKNGLKLCGADQKKGTLYQGYWIVEYMLTELRNHVDHWNKGDDNRKYLKDDLKRTLSDPITDAESPGNFFILISILFLTGYFFIEVMQTWVDTDEYLK